MKILTILLILLSLNLSAQTLHTDRGEVKANYVMVYLTYYNTTEQSYFASIDLGGESNVKKFPIIKEGTTKKRFNSPAELIAFMDRRNFGFVRVITYIERKGARGVEWYSAWIFMRE